MPERHPRKLTVTSCAEYRRGHGKSGEWVIYDVKAVDEKGVTVDAKLRTFKALPIGQEQTYEVEKHVHDTYGESFTLYPPRRKSSERLDDVEARLGELEETVRRLTARLESGATPQENAGSSSGIEY